MGSEAIFDSDLAVVKDNSFRNTPEILEHLNQCIQEAFFVLPAVSKTHGRTAVAESGTEQVDCRFDTIQINGRFAPVNLQSISCRNVNATLILDHSDTEKVYH